MPRRALPLLLAFACAPTATPGTSVRDAFHDVSDAFAGPFPRPALFDDAGRPQLASFPNPASVKFVDDVARLVEEDTRGFGQSSTVYFAFDGALDAARAADPAYSGIVRVGTTVRQPVLVRFLADPGPFGAPNLLALRPRPGVPLAPSADHVAFVRRDLQDASGAALGVPLATATLLAGQRPEGMGEAEFQRFSAAVDTLRAAGVAPADVAALTVFRTDDATAAFGEFVAHARRQPLPAPGAFELVDTFDAFCVFRASVELPVYQDGVAPYSTSGGRWRLDGTGAPLPDHRDAARVFVTVPRRALPDDVPVALFVRTGGGGDRPLVDRGLRTEPLGSTTPGTGPANWLARAGWAGISVDGPHGGPRNVSGGDEQFLMFNVLNPAAMRDNTRQSALELVRVLDALPSWSLDVSACDGVGPRTSPLGFDAANVVVIGHSMGATIAPLVLSAASGVRAAVLSGAGASYVENVVHKEKPVAVRPIADALLGYDALGRTLDPFDPVLSLVQWAAEPADPPAYALAAPPGLHLLVFQGIVDHYILPPMANALALPYGLSLAGPALDGGDARLEAFEPLSTLLPAGRTLPLPHAAPASTATRAVVQLAQDAIEDGHEVMYQRPEAARAVECLLRSLARDRVVLDLAGCE